jgi:hypothetical protein
MSAGRNTLDNNEAGMSAEAMVIIMSVILMMGSLTVVFFLYTEITPSELPRWSRAKWDLFGQQRARAFPVMTGWGRMLFVRSREAVNWVVAFLKPALRFYAGNFTTLLKWGATTSRVTTNVVADLRSLRIARRADDPARDTL